MKKFLDYKKVDWFILFTLIIIIFFKFLSYEHYPVHDEVKSITLVSSLKTFLLKFGGLNHYISTGIGNFIIYIFGVDLLKLRLISLISFFIIIFIFQKKLKDLTKTLLLILICLFVDVIINYYSLYRGYAISSLLFTYIFFLLNDDEKKIHNSKIIFFILSVLIFHNQSTLFMAIPLLLVVSLNLLRTNVFNFYPYKIILSYFCIPFLLMLFMFSFAEGVKLKKLFLNYSDFSQLLQLINKDIFVIFYSGFIELFFNKFTTVSISENIDNFFGIIKSNILFFLIFLISLIKCFYLLFFKKEFKPINFVILLFFIIFFIINKNGPVRIYTGFVSFFLIYILKDINLNLFFNKKYNIDLIIRISLLIVILLKIFNIDFIKSVNLKSEYIFFSNKIDNCNFPSNKEAFEFNKHMVYYVYLNECKKKPNIFRFYRFYKS
jgi:hypothetical protein